MGQVYSSVRSAGDTGSAVWQCRAVDVVNDVPDAYFEFLQSPARDTGKARSELIAKESVSKNMSLQIERLTIGEVLFEEKLERRCLLEKENYLH